jgi:hypothetical protein
MHLRCKIFGTIADLIREHRFRVLAQVIVSKLAKLLLPNRLSSQDSKKCDGADQSGIFATIFDFSLFIAFFGGTNQRAIKVT